MTLQKAFDINVRGVFWLAAVYIMLSVANFLVMMPILPETSIAVFGWYAFLSGPTGHMLAFHMLPEDWTDRIVTTYVICTLLLTPALLFSCHRHPTFKGWAIGAAILLWLGGGFLSFSYNFAYAA